MVRGRGGQTKTIEETDKTFLNILIPDAFEREIFHVLYHPLVSYNNERPAVLVVSTEKKNIYEVISLTSHGGPLQNGLGSVHDKGLPIFS